VNTPVQDPARVARRRREHERQAVVFGVLVAFLLVASLGALAIYTGALTAPFARPFTSSEQETTTEPAPCLPAVDGQPDGALPLPYDQVKVRVFNASGMSGLATANQKVLAGRGFDVLGTGNYNSTYDAELPTGSTLTSNELRFGPKGVVAAYTLAAQFPDMRLVLDDREDATVDLLVGEEYERPLDEADVPLAADQPLTNAKGCEPVDEVEPVPAPTPAEEK
jgi:hypothetical protein